MAIWLGIVFLIAACVPQTDSQYASCEASASRAVDCRDEGLRYLDGEGVDRDPATAVAYFVAACEGGDAEGCLLAARKYHSFSAVQGVERDVDRARDLAARSCDLGLADGCFYAGIVHRGAESVRFYLAGCDEGDVDGCLRAARLYAAGSGIARDQTRAVDLFATACDRGHPDGCFETSRHYATGAGVAEDRQRSVAYFDMTCDLIADAQDEEGRRVPTGWGILDGLSLARVCEFGYDPNFSGCERDLSLCEGTRSAVWRRS
jgi:hypothetical protein